jgi:hypothetical protein
MRCKIHDQPLTMTCEGCSDNMCPACAEYIDGRWFCPRCAVKERRIAAGLDYYDQMAIGFGDSGYESEAGSSGVADH